MKVCEGCGLDKDLLGILKMCNWLLLQMNIKEEDDDDVDEVNVALFMVLLSFLPNILCLLIILWVIPLFELFLLPICMLA